MISNAIDGIASIANVPRETIVQALETLIVSIIGFIFLVALLSGQA